jgi:hypothetical protein
MGGPEDRIMTTRIKPRERKWAIIGEDGRHVWVGRHSDPTEAEIAQAEEALAKQGLAGWLAIVEGDYWKLGKEGCLGFVMVRPLAQPSASFDAGTSAFLARRRMALAGLAE